ncbi:hypothetical protein B0H17DRAFT_266481 [Mycena rosella]|uniref:Uncharacterized protein n=1 Tax=Mycena rosella TaxID=1033263 RepID=A0AAD7DVA6_MYCRO|nr:hypothetical protein B0H17DRAFT_266481 [Mycena rosella]
MSSWKSDFESALRAPSRELTRMADGMHILCSATSWLQHHSIRDIWRSVRRETLSERFRSLRSATRPRDSGRPRSNTSNAFRRATSQVKNYLWGMRTQEQAKGDSQWRIYKTCLKTPFYKVWIHEPPVPGRCLHLIIPLGSSPRYQLLRARKRVGLLGRTGSENSALATSLLRFVSLRLVVPWAQFLQRNHGWSLPAAASLWIPTPHS